MAMLGKVKYYKASPEKRMVDHMLSEAGHYNGDIHMAALSALDYSRDYAEGAEKNAFWYRVYCRLEYAELNLITIDKIGG